jgi:hypothetical protein
MPSFVRLQEHIRMRKYVEEQWRNLESYKQGLRETQEALISMEKELAKDELKILALLLHEVGAFSEYMWNTRRGYQSQWDSPSVVCFIDASLAKP